MTAKQFTSVWLREPRKPTSPGRSREEIVRATLDLLDAEGLAGLSMRKLGAKLKAGATSLYWYVANKDELLELAYDAIWGELSTPVPEDAHWREVASVLAHSMRQVILRHPWSADLIGRVPAFGPNALAFTERMCRAFKTAGFRGLDIDYANATLTAYVFGYTIPEVAWNSSVGHDYDLDEMRESVKRAAEGHLELMERLGAADHDEDPQVMREVGFDFGLVSVLDGLERRLGT
ncbi:TetR/AcrR family transcriptional regulator [Nonomuraea sp. NEAU-A123]|uniref:TetR/AcrR family transcriptional regulator n=1 Tax=Nonomuraea sp. NEAU-A123 TaxID=2839649 RepID=UPI001BE45A30|nr:TetR/AcrR family transcriptional regulator [Nonomuraea sp. NEAU-A123]MBT2235435.1 TetR/AcrR family transcriptional regulator C-terminal domain-containing protein [Nonomuraea sp. NEAU-A123]